MFLSDYPRGLVNCLWRRWFPAFDALPVTPALPVAFLLARSRLPVALLGLPSRPLPRRLPALLAAIALARLPRMESVARTLSADNTAAAADARMLPPSTRLPFARTCKILGRAHGR